MRPVLKPLSTLLIAGGVCLALWPVGQFAYGKWSQNRLAAQFQTQPKPKPKTKTKAKVVKTSVQKPKIAPWPLTKISIPDINLDAYVVQGWDDASLRRGPGHYERSSLPGTGNCVIAGHRNVYGSPFGDLDRLAPGSVVTLENRDGTYSFIVDSISVASASDWSVVAQPAPGSPPMLTLVTCTLPHTPNRVVVRAFLAE